MAFMGHINLKVGTKKLVLIVHQNELFPVPDGGDKRDRTADLLNAIQEQKHLQFPQFGIIVVIPLETKKSQNLLELSRFGEFS